MSNDLNTLSIVADSPLNRDQSTSELNHHQIIRLIESRDHKAINLKLASIMGSEEILEKVKATVKSYLIYLIKNKPQNRYAQLNQEALLQVAENYKSIFGQSMYSDIQKCINEMSKYSETNNHSSGIVHEDQKKNDLGVSGITIEMINEKLYLIDHILNNISSPPTEEQQKYLQAILRDCPKKWCLNIELQTLRAA